MMVNLDQSQLSELEALGTKLGVSEEVMKASVSAVTERVSDSVETTVEEILVRERYGRAEYVKVEPLTATARTRSIKLSNLAQVGTWEKIELGAGIVLTSAEIAAKVHPISHPIIIAAGLLIMIASFTRAITVEFSEREASVFWGLIKACDDEKVATLDAVLERTNEVRNNVGLNSLNEGEIRLALSVLESINCISPVEEKQDTWIIKESWSKHSSTRRKYEW